MFVVRAAVDGCSRSNLRALSLSKGRNIGFDRLSQRCAYRRALTHVCPQPVEGHSQAGFDELSRR